MDGLAFTVTLIADPVLSHPEAFRTYSVPVYVPAVVGKPLIEIGLAGRVVQAISVSEDQSILYWLGEPVVKE